MRIAIIGGGLIGLATAWRLRRLGCLVDLFDGAPEAREASWAAAGMLAPHHEAVGDTPVWRLGCASFDRWPGFLAELGVSAEEADFHRDGGWLPRVDATDEAVLAAKEGWCSRMGVPCMRLDAPALHRVEPALAGADGALWIEAGQVDPRRLARILRARCDELGVRLRYGVAVTGLEPGVVIAEGRHAGFDRIVLAAGAWTPALAELAGIDLPGEPVFGQMVRFADHPPLRRFTHGHHAYLVPRAGSGLVVGSTMSGGSFDRSDNAEHVRRLAAGAARLMPTLAGRTPDETWTGLRPRLVHSQPVIATVTSAQAGPVVLATGHFRNGVLLTPITADAVAGVLGLMAAPVDPGLHASQ